MHGTLGGSAALPTCPPYCPPYWQVVHHGDKPSEVSPASFKRFLCDTPLQWEGPAQHPAGG